MELTYKELESLLEKTLAQPIGLMISTSDTNAFRRKFYQYRAKLQDLGINTYDGIKVRIIEDDKTIYLVKEDEEKALCEQNRI